MLSHSVMSDFVTLWIVACQIPLHEISQSRILEWVAIPFSRGSSRSRDQTQVSCIAGRFFTIRATRKALFVVRINENDTANVLRVILGTPQVLHQWCFH